MIHPFEAPLIEGLELNGLIGSGASGRVYLAVDRAGVPYAVKVFDPLAIQRPLLSRMTARLEAGGWPVGVMPVIDARFDGRPAYRVTPLLGDRSGDGPGLPRSLQYRLADFPGPASWPVIRELARALAAMHARHVAHGNLKPGNVYFTESGILQLTDWTLGNMPGLGHLEFTDALLYQPPEQLRSPGGYTEEAGYRWDVFAFGVLAYRLLTGKFPRCNETFSLVAPPPGERHREGIQADLPRIAHNLEAQPLAAWPDEATSPRESGLRTWILRCLSLDPHDRPATMGDVVAGFTAVERQLAADAEREQLLDQRRNADRRARRSSFAAGAATGVAVVAAGLLQFQTSRLIRERAAWAAEEGTLRTTTTAATSQRDTARDEAREAREALEYERDLALARLEASRRIGDRLFSWAMEKGHRSLPALDGRTQRLKRLEAYFEEFIARTADVPPLADEHARIRLQLAEISLAAGDAETATSRLTEAVEAWNVSQKDADWKLRVASNRLLLARLLQARNDPQTAAAFAAARTALGEIPAAETDADRLSQLSAVLDFHEAKLLASRGEDTTALEQLMRATQALNRLASQRPDSIVPRAELAACYLSSATVLEGMGKLGDAHQARLLATGEMQKLLEVDPSDPLIRLELAGCYGAIAEAAVLGGDIGTAESQSAEAMKLLLTLVREQPDHAEAVSRLAAQYGLRAGLMQDRGQAEDAVKSYDEGIRLLESIRASQPDNANASYRLALLWWQKGRMLGFSGKRDEEIALITRARKLLELVEAQPRPDGPPAEQLQRSSGYLLGDLGHAYQLAEQRDPAVSAFDQAAAFWERLLKSRPQSEEYEEALVWCRERAREIQGGDD